MKAIPVTVVAVAVALTGCSSVEILQSATGNPSISGVVKRDLIKPDVVEVTLEGKTYRGEWRSDNPTPEQKKEIRYPHRKHTYRVVSVLTADDGSKLACSWLINGDTGDGSCAAGDRDFPLTLKTE